MRRRRNNEKIIKKRRSRNVEKEIREESVKEAVEVDR